MEALNDSNPGGTKFQEAPGDNLCLHYSLSEITSVAKWEKLPSSLKLWALTCTTRGKERLRGGFIAAHKEGRHAAMLLYTDAFRCNSMPIVFGVQNRAMEKTFLRWSIPSLEIGCWGRERACSAVAAKKLCFFHASKSYQSGPQNLNISSSYKT